MFVTSMPLPISQPSSMAFTRHALFSLHSQQLHPVKALMCHACTLNSTGIRMFEFEFSLSMLAFILIPQAIKMAATYEGLPLDTF